MIIIIFYGFQFIVKKYLDIFSNQEMVFINDTRNL
jgi:hypothetical protein